MQYVNRMKELENKLTAVGHIVGEAEQKRVLLRGLRAEFAVTDCVIREMEKALQGSIRLLVIQEAEFVIEDGDHALKKEQVFTVKQPDRAREC